MPQRGGTPRRAGSRRCSARGCWRRRWARSRSMATRRRRSRRSRRAARVSRRTFYELFEDREQCLAALIEDVVAMVQGELAAAGWRVCRGASGCAGALRRSSCSSTASRRSRGCSSCRRCVAARRCWSVASRSSRVWPRCSTRVAGRVRARAICTPLTAEGLVGAALGIRPCAAVCVASAAPLVVCSGELMGMIVLPYLGPAAARREQARPPQTPVAARVVGARRSGCSLRATRCRAYRCASPIAPRVCCRCIAAQPGVSNREVAEHAGVPDQGQISKLLARLERLELCERTGSGHQKGEANSWELTALGRQVAQQLRVRAA